jgi:hypothetical protein
VEKILHLHQELVKKKREVNDLEGRCVTLLETDPLDASLEELDLAMADSTAHRDRLISSLRKQSQTLGISEQASLKKLIKSEYLTLRMNMRAKKQCIWEQICRQKFELSRIEHSHRHSVNGKSD